MRGRTTLLIGIACASAIWAQEPMRKSFGDPARFEKTISAFEAADKLAPPPKGAILCTGSSSMRGWHHRIADDLAPLTVIAVVSVAAIITTCCTMRSRRSRLSAAGGVALRGGQ